MVDVDFASLLSKPVDDAKKPPTLPAGTYFGQITRYSFDKAKNENETPFVRFDLVITHAGDDIDPDDIAGIDLSKRKLRAEYYLTEDSIYRLKDLLVSLKIPTSHRSFNETLPETQGQPVMISVVQSPNKKDPTSPYVNVRELAGVPEA